MSIADIENIEKRDLQRIFAETERDAHAKLDQVMMGLGDAINLLAGYRGKTGIEVAMEILHLDEQRQKQTLQDALFVILIDQMRNEIGDFQSRINRNNEEIGRLKSQATLIRSLIERLDDGEMFELNADGTLKDAKAEAIIQAYEDKYGVTVDRNNPAELRNVLKDIEERIETLEIENSVWEAEIAKRESIIKGLESSKPETRIAALKEVTELAPSSKEADIRVVDDIITHTSTERALSIIDALDITDVEKNYTAEGIDGEDFWSDSAMSVQDMDKGIITAEFQAVQEDVPSPVLPEATEDDVSVIPDLPTKKL